MNATSHAARSMIVFGAQEAPWHSVLAPFPRVTVDGVTVRCAIAGGRAPSFDRKTPDLSHAVLLRVRAVSCNYRDRNFIYAMRNVPSHRFSPIGSEFAAEVLDVGDAVTSLRPGDRVLPNHHYVGGQPSASGVREGVVTNQASRELQVQPAAKLLKVPHRMSWDAAAAFSLGAQTAYSMVRRASLVRGTKVLVTAATSNTSLFLLAALRNHDVTVYASTTSRQFDARLRALGVREVVRIERGADTGRTIPAFAADVGGIDVVFDPFFDLHLDAAVDALAPLGTYLTCGCLGQNPHSSSLTATRRLDARHALAGAILKNLTLVGNCLGRGDDLERALADYEAGTFDSIIDSCFEGDNVVGFLDRTFNAPDRFGKVVFRFPDN